MGFEVAGRDADERVLVIAEIGNNHEGDPGLARELLAAAVEAGADAVKFQTFVVEQFIDRDEADRFRQLGEYALEFETFASLAEQARELGAAFISTALDAASAEFLEGIVDAHKVASGDNDHYPLIRQLAAGARPIILSTGLSDLDRVQRAVDAVRSVRGDERGLALLHCVSAYPAEAAELNLAAIGTLRERFGLTTGYSDHALGAEAAVAAVSAGARIVEKHFTVAGIESDFRDHALSADQDVLRALVGRIRETEAMLGRPEKRMQEGERGVDEAVRRSAIAAREMNVGELVGDADVWWVRPGGGIAPSAADQLIGRRLAKPIAAGERFAADHLEAAAG